MELAALQIAIDSRQVKTAKEWLDDLTGAGTRAEKAMGGVGAGGRTAAAGNTAAAASARSAADAFNQQESAARRLTATIRQYASIVVGAFSAREIIRMADEWGQYASRLRIATQQSGDFAEVQQRMLDVSNRVYKSFGNSAEMYIRTAKALQQLGYSSQQAGDLVETLQYSLTVSAADSQKSAAVIDALSKSILTGKVAMDQFNTVVAYNPRLQQAMADAITKGSLSALQKMVADGKLTVAQLMKVTTEMERMGQEADQMPVTMEDAAQRMTNKMTAFFGRVNESTGAVNLLTGAVDRFGDAMDRIDISAVARDFAAVATTWELISAKAVEAWEAVDDFGQQFQSFLGLSGDGVRSLGEGIATSFEQSFLNTAKELDALYDGIMGTIASMGAGFRALGENIAAVFVWGFDKALASFSNLTVTVSDWLNSTFNTNRFNFKLKEDPGELNLKSLREEADKARQAVEGTLGAYNALKTRLDTKENWGNFNDAFDVPLFEATAGALGRIPPALDKTKTKLTEAQKAAQSFAKQRESDLAAIYKSISAIHEEAQGIEDQVALFGLSKSALEDLAIARLQEQAVILSGFDGSTEAVKAIEAEIEARQRLRSAMGTLEAKELADKANKEAVAEWQRTTEQMGQSLTDALLRGFESGKGFAENLRDTLKNMFRTLVLQPIIQPIMNGVAGTIQGALGMGPGQSGGSGIFGMAQNASSAHSALTGGPSSMLGNAAQWLGRQVGSEALSAFGMGMSGAGGIAAIGTGVGASLGTTIGTSAAAMTSTTFSAALGGTAGVASGSGVVGSVVGGGAAGLGSAIGAALPWVGGALALGSAFGLFDSGPPKTRHGQRTTIDYTGGAFGVSALDDRQAAGSEQAALAAAQSAVAAANDLFAKVGVNAGIESFYAIMESSVLGDRNGVASGGSLRIGDQLRNFGVPQASDMTLGGFGGWSSAEMLPRLQTDIQLSILEAFQALGSQLPSVLSSMLEGVDLRNISAETAQELATRFAAVADGATQFLAAIEAMPFEQLRGLSFDAAAGLVQLAGGVEGLLSAQQTYYQAFYSEAERHGIAVNNLTSALAAAGVVMPELTGSTEQMLASYRAIVEAQDLNTEAGRQVYVALMQASGAFAEVAQYAGQVAQAVEEVAVPARSLADIERERAGLESQLLGLLGNTNALRRRELETLDESNRALQQQIWAYQDLSTAYSAMVEAGQREIAKLQESFGATDTAMSAYRSAVQKLESEFGNLIATIGRGVADLRGQVAEAARMQYDQARAVISTALVTRQLPQTADLTETLRIAQQGVTGQVYGSLFEQQKAYLILANEMEALQGIAKPELDAAQATLVQLENQYRLLRGMSLVGEDSLTALEQQLRTAIATEEAARRQISAIEEQINWAKEQHDRLLEIRDGVLAFPEALAGFASSLAAAIAASKAATPTLPGGGPYTPVPGTGIGSSSWTTDYLYANQDVLKAYDNSWGMTPEAWAQYHYETYGQYEGRKFAAGGFATPGWAMVGEEGPELVNFSNPGRVYTASQTNDILRGFGSGHGGGNAEVVAELRGLREQNARLERRLASIEKSTGQFADQFDNVTAGGNAMLTEDADAL